MTRMLKYGAKNPFASKQLQEKIKAMNMLRYGVENPAKSIEQRKNIRMR